MRRIYVSMDGLTNPTEGYDTYLHTGIAPYARSFLTWASTQGKVVLLTDGPLQHATYLIRKLECSDKVSVGAFSSCKTELLHHADDIYLVDGFLTPSEISWFTEHGLQDRVIPVDIHLGVTQATKQYLESKLTTTKKDHK